MKLQEITKKFKNNYVFYTIFLYINMQCKVFLRHVFAAEFMIKEVKTQRSCHEREET